ncbi:hypothetical protein [Neobacillus vireti]|uniref:hypothetical protein n=1 Tax=Neobacillus vireti TaxID=220686 RepID=UPI002FFE2D84
MQVHGLFEQRENLIFRKSAYLQWGDSKEVIGSIILHNPGGAKLEKNLWNDLNSGKITVAEGQITRDLGKINLIEKVMKKVFTPLEGRLLLLNLFNIVESDPDLAIEKFHSVKDDPLYSELLYPNISLLSDIPWIWIAWTTNESRIEELIERIEPQLISLPHKRFIGDIDEKPHRKFGYSIKAKYPPIADVKRDKLAEILKRQIKEF